MKRQAAFSILCLLLAGCLAAGLAGCPPAPVPMLTADKSSVMVAENGTADFQMKLSARPSASVTVTVARSSGDSDITVQSGGTLTFTASNWNVYQTVTLAGADDADTTNGAATISCEATGLASVEVTATEQDDDTPPIEGEQPQEGEAPPAPSLQTDQTQVTVPEGGTADFQVKLSARPSAEISVTVAWQSGDADISVQTGGTLTFTPSTWSAYQTVTVAAADDVDTENGEATIRCSATGLTSVDVTAAEQDNDSGEEGETVTLPGGVTLEMVWIPAGTFMMGRYAGELDSEASEDPQHSVTVASGFWMGKYELTQAQWKAVMNGANPSYFHGESYGNTDNWPVETVSWDDITQTFLPALNGATGHTFRLPTEAEWEYACRGNTPSRFYWGGDPDYTEIVNFAWFSDTSNGRTHDAGGKLPNAFGLYDMGGNVGEWVQDWYHSDYTDAPADGSAWETPAGSYRVTRGGSWYAYRDKCRSASRFFDNPSLANNFTGFRLVR